jgi:hypothetical protein
MSLQQEKNPRKSSLAGAVMAALCIGIYLFALIQAAVRVYFHIDERRSMAETEFADIAGTASSQGANGFMDEDFIETMENALVSSKTIEALIISGPEGEYAFERHKDQNVIWVNNSPRFANRFDLSRETLHEALHITGLRNVNIRAAAAAFDNNDILQILKDTMFLILIGLMLSFFTIYLYFLMGKTSKHGMHGIPSKPGKKAPAPVYADVTEEIPLQKETSLTLGPYSPRSNIGWESDAEEKLETELRRCASAEKDLVLLVIDFAGKMDDFYYRQAATEAAYFFKLKNMLFENGSQGITVIYPGANLETGIAEAQRFIRYITDKFPSSPYKDSIRAGLTSRCGRLLNAGRMMFEAAEAVSRAKKDKDSPIIAFKSDLDKYRAFIQKRT